MYFPPKLIIDNIISTITMKLTDRKKIVGLTALKLIKKENENTTVLK